LKLYYYSLFFLPRLVFFFTFYGRDVIPSNFGHVGWGRELLG
jgi:hypothetical protein